MSITENLRKQHSAIMDLIDDMSSHLSVQELSADSTHIYGLLLELSDNIVFHLKREDKGLYPALFRHPDKQISTLAKKYIDEMGGISDTFNLYIAGWPHAASIQKKPDKFIEETRRIFDSLGKRIKKEDTILYPLLEIGP